MDLLDILHALICPMRHAPVYKALPLRILSAVTW